MRLMTYNILEGGEGRIDPLAEAIRLARADVVVVQEAWDRGLFEKLADRLGMDCFLAAHPTNAQGGVGLLSKRKIREAVNYGPLDARLTRAAFHAIVEAGKVSLPVIGVHLHPYETFADEDERLKELAGVLEIGRVFSGRPHVIAGDFNSYHPEQMIDVARLRPSSRKRIAGQKDQLPREVVRKMLEAGYVDAHSLHHPAETFGCSFTTAYPAARVDYLFVSPDLCPKVVSCEVFTPAIGRYASDHYPVVAELDLG